MDLAEVQTALSEKTPELEQVRSELSELRSKIEVAQRDLDTKRSDVESEENMQRDLNVLADTAETRLEKARLDLAEVQTALSEEKPELERLRSNLKEIEALIAGRLQFKAKLDAQIEINKTLLKDTGGTNDNELPGSGDK